MKKIIIANWKMNPASLKEAKKLFNAVKKTAVKLKKAEVIICPPFVYLLEFAKCRKLGFRQVAFGAQDAFYAQEKNYMGEISPAMLKNIGVKYVILGHSKKRELGETDDIVNKKIKAVLAGGLKVILCVGERERNAGSAHFDFIKNQIEKDLVGVAKKQLGDLVIAYEPVWAISSNKKATPDTPDSFLQMAVYVRRVFSGLYGIDFARRLPVVYGGSVNSKNATDFLRKGMADGLLVGAKSLDAKEFGEILEIANK